METMHMPAIVVAMLMVACTRGASFTVTPSSHCPNLGDGRCLTLAHIISNANEYFTQNTTLNLLPGYHILDSELQVENISTLEIFGSQSETIITCRGSGRFNVETTFLVHIKDIFFIGCRGNSIELVDRFVLEDCHFHGLSVPLRASNVSGLRLQQVSSAEIASFFSFFNSSDNGGALSVHDSNRILIANSLFLHNHATNASGGAIYVDNSDVTIDKCIFDHNGAQVSGGAVFIESEHESAVVIDDSIFNYNTVSDRDAGQGGAIHVKGSNVTSYIDDSTFTYNKGGHLGGAIFGESSIVTVDDSVFKYNTAYFSGGAICTFHSTLTLDDCIFSDNIVTRSLISYGGALYVRYNEAVIVTDSLFVHNKATRQGGAIFSIYSSSFTVDNGTFEYNSVVYGSGGALRIYQSGPITIDDSIFKDNRANWLGGALYAGDNLALLIDDTVFTYNQAKNSGGAVYAYNNGPVTVDDSTFEHQTATIDNGGAIYSYQNSGLSIDGSVFRNNSATSSGGAVYSHDRGIVKIDDSTFHNNTPSTNYVQPYW